MTGWTFDIVRKQDRVDLEEFLAYQNLKAGVLNEKQKSNEGSRGK